MVTRNGGPPADGVAPSEVSSVHARVLQVFGDSARSPESLTADLVAAYGRAHTAWPTASLALDAFAAAALSRVKPPIETASAQLSAMRLGELYLAAACAAGDAGAILAFESAFFGDIERAFSAPSHGETFLDDARQNLRERLFVTTSERPAGIVNYAGRGSLRRWFRFALTHHTLNLKRTEARAPIPTDDDAEQSLLVPADPELLYLRERYAADFRAAAEEGALRLSASDRSVLQHYYLERLTIDGIAAIYDIHRVTAARRVNTARDALVLLIREALTARLRVDAAELRSILRLLPTQLSLSLRRVLEQPSSP